MANNNVPTTTAAGNSAPTIANVNSTVQATQKASQQEFSTKLRVNQELDQLSDNYRETIKKQAVQTDQAWNVMSEAQRNLQMQTQYPRVVNRVLSLFGDDAHNDKLQAARINSAKIDLSRAMNREEVTSKLFELDAKKLLREQQFAAGKTAMVQQQVDNYSRALDLALKTKAARKQDLNDMIDGLSADQLEQFQADPSKAPASVQHELRQNPGLFEQELLTRQARSLQIMPQLKSLAVSDISPAEFGTKTDKEIAAQFSTPTTELTEGDIRNQRMQLKADEQFLTQAANFDEEQAINEMGKMQPSTLGKLLVESQKAGSVQVGKAKLSTRQIQTAYTASLSNSTKQAMHAVNLEMGEGSAMTGMVSGVETLARAVAAVEGIPYQGLNQQEAATLMVSGQIPPSANAAISALPTPARISVGNQLSNVASVGEVLQNPSLRVFSEDSVKTLATLQSQTEAFNATVNKTVESLIADKPERTKAAYKNYIHNNNITADSSIDILAPDILNAAPFKPGTPLLGAWRVANTTVRDKLMGSGLGVDGKITQSRMMEAYYAKVMGADGKVKQDNEMAVAFQSPAVITRINHTVKQLGVKAAINRLLFVGPEGPRDTPDTSSPYYQIYNPAANDWGPAALNEDGAVSIDAMFEFLAMRDLELLEQGQVAGYVANFKAGLTSDPVYQLAVDNLTGGQIKAEAFGTLAYGSREGFRSAVYDALVETAEIGGGVAARLIENKRRKARNLRRPHSFTSFPFP